MENNNELTINVFELKTAITGTSQKTGKDYSLIPLVATDMNGKSITVKLSGWQQEKAEELVGKQILIFNAYSKVNQWNKTEYSVGTQNTVKVLGEAVGSKPKPYVPGVNSFYQGNARQQTPRGKITMAKLVEATKYFYGMVGGFFPSDQAKAQIVGDLVRTAAACGALDETIAEAVKEGKKEVVEASKQAKSMSAEDKLASIMNSEE